MTLGVIEPKTFPTVRTIYNIDMQGKVIYERLAFLIKKYGCPVTNISDGIDWMRLYFEVPLETKDSFLSEEAGVKVISPGKVVQVKQ